MLAEAGAASSTPQRFWLVVGATPRIFEVCVPPDADAHLRIRARARQLMEMRPVHVGPWAGLIPDEGLSAEVAESVARCTACRLTLVSLDEASGTETSEVLTDRQLAELARRAGGLFVAVADEVRLRAQGVRTAAEVAALETAKND
jgi:hypothetical protein